MTEQAFVCQEKNNKRQKTKDKWQKDKMTKKNKMTKRQKTKDNRQSDKKKHDPPAAFDKIQLTRRA